VSARQSEELSIEDRRYADGRDVQLLDIVEIEFSRPNPHGCQSENHVIDDQVYWRKVGTVNSEHLRSEAVSSGPLWVDGYSSYAGKNDRIPVDVADRLSSSLILVGTDSATILVQPGLKKRQVRVRFSLEGVNYCLPVTDPGVESVFLAKPDGEYVVGYQALMCVSLGEPFEGFRYKLAASLILVA
jgi:hypothetical protein